MTYQFPESLHHLRDHLRSLGCDVKSFATARQAAFMAQQLIGCRIRFPSPGSDMTSTLFLIQKAISDTRGTTSRPSVASKAIVQQASLKLGGKGDKSKPRPEYLRDFDPDLAIAGYHVYADGACVPNPGPGGWAYVAFKDGQEIASDCGGEAETTNNRMEIIAVTRAFGWARQYPTVEITIWSDSQYVVKGVHEWIAGWEAERLAKGQRQGGGENEY